MPPIVKMIPLEGVDVPTSLSLQIRVKGMNQDHIDQMKELIELSDAEQKASGLPIRDDLLPPIVLFVNESTAVVGDGLHRLCAHIAAKRWAIKCEVHEVSDPHWEARKYSARANSSQKALPRDSATCRAAYRLIRDMFPDLPLYTEGGVCDLTGLTKSVVGKYAKEDESKGISVPYKHEKVRQRHASNPAPPADDVAASNPDKAPRGVSGGPRPSDKSDAVDSKPAASAPESRQDKFIDKAGREVPPGLRDKYNAQEAASWVHRLGVIRGEIDELAGNPKWAFLDVARAGRFVESLQAAFKEAAYHTECPRCDMDKSCTLCRGEGYITGSQYRRLSDKDLEKLKQ